MVDGTCHHPEEERLWGNMPHIYIDKYMGKPLREVLTPLPGLSGPTQSGLIGPLLYNPFRLTSFV